MPVNTRRKQLELNKRRQGIRYTNAGEDYFARRRLQKYAGVWSLWALGTGAVISGHYSGWNLGLASGGWGGMISYIDFLKHYAANR